MLVVLFENGAPGTIRTSDPQIRSLMLYPAELRARIGEARLVGFFLKVQARCDMERLLLEEGL